MVPNRKDQLVSYKAGLEPGHVVEFSRFHVEVSSKFEVKSSSRVSGGDDLEAQLSGGCK